MCAATLYVLATSIVPAAAQVPQQHAWLDPGLLQQAKAEGALTVYGSMNEAEALPLWKRFEDESGIKVSYVRSSDTQIMARVAIEERARQRSWDIALTTTVPQLPTAFLAPFDPPQASGLMPQARDPNRRWYGVYANYNAPAYNTKVVKQPELPKSYEDFAAHKEWRGKIAIDGTDNEWLAAICGAYGEERGRAIVGDVEHHERRAFDRRARSGDRGRPPRSRALGRLGRILDGAQQFPAADLERENVRRADRLLAAQSGDADFRLGRRQRAGAA